MPSPGMPPGTEPRTCLHCCAEIAWAKRDHPERYRRKRFCSKACIKRHKELRVPAGARFWSMVEEVASGCWLWMGKRSRDGYGWFSASGMQVRAHRFAWQMEHGPIAPGMFICHRCDNPQCVRPAHLFSGTPQENVDDKIKKGRARIGELSESGRAAISVAARRRWERARRKGS